MPLARSYFAVLLSASLFAAGLLPARAPADSPSPWKSLGPSAIDERAVGFGWNAGRVSDLLIDDSGTLWAATAGGGIWFRRRADSSWTESNDGLTTLAFGSIDHYQSTFYAASGEFHNCSDCLLGDGLFISTNGGQHWTQVIDPAIPRGHSSFVRVVAADGSTVLLGGDFGLLRWTKSDGHWSVIQRPNHTSNVLEKFDQPRSLAIVPADHALVVADEDWVYRSTDGGMTWAPVLFDVSPTAEYDPVSSPVGIDGALAVTPAAPTQVVATFATTRTHHNYGCSMGLYISTDGGAHFSKVRDGNWDQYSLHAYYDTDDTGGCQGWYDNALAVNPTKAVEYNRAGITLLQSTDAAETWGDTTVTWSIHPDIHALVYDPSGTSLYLGEDGGVVEYPSSDHQHDSAFSLNQNLAVAQFYGPGFAADDGSLVLGGTQDNGTIELFNALGDGRTAPPTCPLPVTTGSSPTTASSLGASSPLLPAITAAPGATTASIDSQSSRPALASTSAPPATASPSPTPSATPSVPWPQWAWRSIHGGDGGAVVANPRNHQQLYAEYALGGLEASFNGGCTWTWIPPPMTSVAFVMPFVTTDDWNTIIAGGNDVYVSVNAGGAVQPSPSTNAGGAVQPSPSTNAGGAVQPSPSSTNAGGAVQPSPSADDWKAQEALPDGSTITALWASGDGTTIIAGRDNGTLVKRLGSAAHWAPDNVDRKAVTSIAVDPNNPDHVVVSTADWSLGTCNVLETTHFDNVDPLTPTRYNSILSSLRCPIDALAFHDGKLYAGAGAGVWQYAPDQQPIWQQVGTGLPPVPVVGLHFLVPSGMIVFTHGRGAWYVPSLTTTSISDSDY